MLERGNVFSKVESHRDVIVKPQNRAPWLLCMLSPLGSPDLQKGRSLCSQGHIPKAMGPRESSHPLASVHRACRLLLTCHSELTVKGLQHTIWRGHFPAPTLKYLSKYYQFPTASMVTARVRTITGFCRSQGVGALSSTVFAWADARCVAVPVTFYFRWIHASQHQTRLGFHEKESSVPQLVKSPAWS